MKSKVAFLGLVIVGVGGCSPDPELVFIDRSRFAEVDLRPAATGMSIPTRSIAGATFSLPSLNTRTLYVASVRERFESAMLQVQSDQEALVRQMFEALRKLYMGELATLEARERERIEEEGEVALDEAYAQVRAIFEKYAKPIGQKWIRLSWLVGFPDPDPRSRRAPRTDNKEQIARFEEAVRLRKEIRELGELYRDEVGAQLQVVNNEQRALLAQLAQEFNIRRIEREAEAEAEAKEIGLRAISQLQGFVLDPTQVLPPLPGDQVVVPPAGTTIPRLDPAPGETAFAPTERLADQIKIFTGIHHYELSSTPRGARNVTEEFARWRSRYDSAR